jgi:hypothetical protein
MDTFNQSLAREAASPLRGLIRTETLWRPSPLERSDYGVVAAVPPVVMTAGN